ncbi:hypothetical protein GCM10023169_14280 [Georgenia halophila]|uniref:Lipoprotein n=1 Tax=Georgenia halophila TaxID=620889 RepID=A0ABP8L3H0_9MICO
MQVARRTRKLVAAGVLGLLAAPGVVACSDEPEELPAALTCTLFYRPEAGSAAGEEHVDLTVPRADHLTPAPERATFEGLVVEVTYTGEAPEGRNVRVVVSSGDALLLTSLYQVEPGSALDGQFGAHGFTGLQYVRDGDAELQFTCAPAES